MKSARIAGLISAGVICAVAIAVPRVATATGTATVQQKDGTTKVYKAVQIKIRDQAMALISADGQGMIVLGKAACTKVGALVRCIPYDATLDQYGKSYHIPLQSGTVWVNPTKSEQPLAFTSGKLGPRGVLLSVQTKAGTYFSLTGTIDEVQK